MAICVPMLGHVFCTVTGLLCVFVLLLCWSCPEIAFPEQN